MRIKNLRGSVRSDFKKTRLLHLGNFGKPPHPQFFAQRAPEGLNFIVNKGITRQRKRYLTPSALELTIDQNFKPISIVQIICYSILGFKRKIMLNFSWLTRRRVTVVRTLQILKVLRAPMLRCGAPSPSTLKDPNSPLDLKGSLCKYILKF